MFEKKPEYHYFPKELVFDTHPEQLVYNHNLSTIRLAYEDTEQDPYEKLAPRDKFDFIMRYKGYPADLGKGTIIAHWKHPFQEIPTELICAQEFPKANIKTNFRKEMKAILKRIYNRGERKFTNDNQLFHIILYTYPKSILTDFVILGFIHNSLAFELEEERENRIFYSDDCWEEIFQQDNESSDDWLHRRLQSNYDNCTLPDFLFTSKSYKLLKLQQNRIRNRR